MYLSLIMVGFKSGEIDSSSVDKQIQLHHSSIELVMNILNGTAGDVLKPRCTSDHQTVLQSE